MAGWFRKGLSPHQTAIAMIGPKPGDQIVVAGASDPALAAEVALVSGLNGSTSVADRDPSARARVEAAARHAGALMEFAEMNSASLPMPDGSHDVVVLMAAAGSDEPGVAVTEALRVLRPGGRIIVIEGTKAGGVFRSRSTSPRRPAEEVLQLLERAGTRAQRQLADVDGVSYFEARK